MSSSISGLFHRLDFGTSEEIELVPKTLFEESSSKGSNGLIAEYVCARTLSQKLTSTGLEVKTPISILKNKEKDAIDRLRKEMTSVELDRAINQGTAIAESIYDSILHNGKDLIFTSYEFKSKQHSYSIEPTGAQTNKGISSDMTLTVYKKSTDEIAEEILISLKAYRSSKTSQGSKSSIAALSSMFANKKMTKDEFSKFFGSKGKKFLNELELFKKTGDEYLKSPGGRKLSKYLKSKGRSVSASGNVLRNKELGDNFKEKFGYKQEAKLAGEFVELFNTGTQRITSSNKDTFIEAFKKVAGFDDVVTYNAIADKKGIVTEVINSNISSGYKKIFEALKDHSDVVLKHRKGTGSIDVEVVHGDDVIRSLSLLMWKDGTIQFKFDSKK
jgi:hypothetical protein